MERKFSQITINLNSILLNTIKYTEISDTEAIQFYARTCAYSTDFSSIQLECGRSAEWNCIVYNLNCIYCTSSQINAVRCHSPPNQSQLYIRVTWLYEQLHGQSMHAGVYSTQSSPRRWVFWYDHSYTGRRDTTQLDPTLFFIFFIASFGVVPACERVINHSFNSYRNCKLNLYHLYPCSVNSFSYFSFSFYGASSLLV